MAAWPSQCRRLSTLGIDTGLSLVYHLRYQEVKGMNRKQEFSDQRTAEAIRALLIVCTMVALGAALMAWGVTTMFAAGY